MAWPPCQNKYQITTGKERWLSQSPGKAGSQQKSRTSRVFGSPVESRSQVTADTEESRPRGIASVLFESEPCYQKALVRPEGWIRV